ncbi:MAG: Rieske (2Fe-2S) protein [Acidobacteriota bacterium]
MKDCNEMVDCVGRREFLVKSAFIAGGLVLTLSGAASVFGKAVNGTDVVIPIDDKSPLNKVGGSQIVESAKGQIIVVRTGDASFVAFSAICTHKRGVVEYDAAKKQFECPNHSKFDASNGNVIDGPADDPLPKFTATGTSTSVIVAVG